MKNNFNIDMVEYVTKVVIEELKNHNITIENNRSSFVPVGISARHLHLKKEDLEALFGRGYQLTVFKNISQPGQFAANEKVTLLGPKGTIENVRILGPVRNETQVELSLSDARKLGINPPVRESGELEGTPGIKIIGHLGSITIDKGCIIAERHIHMTPSDAQNYGVKNGQKVKVRVGGIKGGIMDNVSVKVREDFALDMHIDTDDANAFGIKNGDKLEIITE